MKQSAQTTIHVSVSDQRLRLFRSGDVVAEFPVSTAARGVGFKSGSMKTPLGRFRIAQKIGGEYPAGTVFKGRKAVSASLKHGPDEDLIVSRILWLDGLGVRNANSRARFIYIHGTNHEDQIGQPASHGCVRMRNADVVELFDLVTVNTPVVITRAAPRKDALLAPRKPLRAGDNPPT